MRINWGRYLPWARIKEPPMPSVNTDWANPSSPITAHFTVHEALWLPNLKIHHTPTEEEKAEILLTAKKAEEVRQLIGKPMIITSWLRPAKINGGPGYRYNGKSYNTMVPGAALKSLHVVGKAFDFVVPGISADDVRDLLRPRLEFLQLRMEDMKGFSWIHLDRAEVAPGGVRTFRV